MVAITRSSSARRAGNIRTNTRSHPEIYDTNTPRAEGNDTPRAEGTDTPRAEGNETDTPRAEGNGPNTSGVYKSKTRFLRTLFGNKTGIEFKARVATYKALPGYRRMTRDGLHRILYAWFDVEGRNSRGHKASAHSFNSINKHVGEVTVRSVNVVLPDTGSQGAGFQAELTNTPNALNRIIADTGSVCAVLHAIFGDADKAWVFEEEPGGQIVDMGRLDRENATFVNAYKKLGTLEFMRANADVCQRLETALFGQ